MDKLGRILSMIEHSLNTKKRRHIVGGILVSISLLFGGLAVTVLTLKVDDVPEEPDERIDSDEYEFICSE